MAQYTDGASKYHVELHILRVLAGGEWKTAGEIKDYVERNASIPPAASRSLRGRSAEGQVRNTVQNALSPSRAGSLSQSVCVDYNRTSGYRINVAGRKKLEELERIDQSLRDVGFE